jgi:DNA-binding transcriptional ArsR family regulator
MDSRQAELFKVLGVESRIRIIELLKKKGPLGVNDLSAALRISASAVSQHLKVLKYAGLVRNERKGYWIPYQVDPAALEKCRDLLAKVCTCGCRGTGRLREAELNKTRQRISFHYYESTNGNCRRNSKKSEKGSRRCNRSPLFFASHSVCA